MATGAPPGGTSTPPVPVDPLVAVPPDGTTALDASRVDARGLPPGFPTLVWTRGPRTVGVYGRAGGCTEATAQLVDQTPEAVTVRVVQTTTSTGPCTRELRYPPLEVTLAADLGQRRVVLTGEIPLSGIGGEILRAEVMGTGPGRSRETGPAPAVPVPRRRRPSGRHILVARAVPPFRRAGVTPPARSPACPPPNGGVKPLGGREQPLVPAPIPRRSVTTGGVVAARTGVAHPGGGRRVRAVAGCQPAAACRLACPRQLAA